MSRKESADDYDDVVVRLDKRHRVILCKDGIQWILQVGKLAGKGRGTQWRGYGYFISRDGLLSACAWLHDPLPAPHELTSLPEYVRNPKRNTP